MNDKVHIIAPSSFDIAFCKLSHLNVAQEKTSHHFLVLDQGDFMLWCVGRSALFENPRNLSCFNRREALVAAGCLDK
jgi:hypothetical protein